MGGWPSLRGSLGPMARTVTDLVKLLDVMVGYDPEDPLTASGVGHVPSTYTQFLDKDGLKGARIGVLRESVGDMSDPTSEDFKKVEVVYDRAIEGLRAAGAEVVDPILIPRLKELLREKIRIDGSTYGGSLGDSWAVYVARNPNIPYKTRDEMRKSPDYAKVWQFGQPQAPVDSITAQLRDGEGRRAREELMILYLKVMADNNLDAIIHKSVEHQPTLIREGMNPPYYDMRGALALNTSLIYVPAISVPAGFTTDDLPVAISFLSRPYNDGLVIKLAYAYEQATHHRRPPPTVPPLR